MIQRPDRILLYPETSNWLPLSVKAQWVSTCTIHIDCLLGLAVGIGFRMFSMLHCLRSNRAEPVFFSYIPHRFGFQLHAGGGAATRIRGAGRGCRARKGEQKEHFECRGDSTVLEGQISNAIRHRDCARAASHQNASAFPSQTPDGPAL